MSFNVHILWISMIFIAKGWTALSAERCWTLGQWPSKRQEMQSLVTLVSHVISGGDVTLLAPQALSYLPLPPPPIHNTFFTIKTCHLYSYGDIFCIWRKNEAFLFLRMTLFWLSATAPTLETTGIYKKSCSSMSFINLKAVRILGLRKKVKDGNLPVIYQGQKKRV